MNYLLAAIIFSPVVVFVAWLNVVGRRETRRRSLLPDDERRALEEEDAIWAQEYGF